MILASFLLKALILHPIYASVTLRTMEQWPFKLCQALFPDSLWAFLLAFQNPNTCIHKADS